MAEAQILMTLTCGSYSKDKRSFKICVRLKQMNNLIKPKTKLNARLTKSLMTFDQGLINIHGTLPKQYTSIIKFTIDECNASLS